MKKILFTWVAISTATAVSQAVLAADIDISQSPVFVSAAVPPLNMLVMGRDHKLYYEAYNDASDLNGDGILDIGYKGYLPKADGGIDYYGYFNSNVCYTNTDKILFVPSSLATGSNNKECGGKWSGDYLNYLTTSRMDALRKVLYGGYRSVDTARSGNTPSSTVLQAAYIPQDAHSWGKEYSNIATDGYDIRLYTPLSLPSTGLKHLFAVASIADNTAPLLRVLNNTSFRIWNWVSKERVVADTTCVNSSRATVNCAYGGGASDAWSEVPATVLSGLTITTWKDSIASPASLAEMNTLFNSSNSGSSTRCGVGSVSTIKSSGTANSNPFVPGAKNCTHDNYHTLVEGIFTPAISGTYKFAVDGDDAVDVAINSSVVASWYGGHGASSSDSSLDAHSGSVWLDAGRSYPIKFRHEEGSGGDSWNLYWQPPGNQASTMTDYSIKVETCPATAALRESTCQIYLDGSVKPTGILHDYGQSDKMYFGLLSGSYANNISGGVLRSNIQSFTNEINMANGLFKSNVSGIVDTINKFRTYDFNYGNHVYGCGFITNRAMKQSDTCYMWGNPIGEMMYESMRYFAGATTPTPLYDYSSGPDVTLALPKPAWTPPYAAVANGRAAYPSCAVPAMTVISDINPSYDYKLPGGKTSWQEEDGGSGFSNSGDPASIRNLNVSTEVDAIWAAEGGGSRSIFIGESNGVSDGAPTAKTVTNLSTVRGLAPEEPTKKGTYYSAGVARYGAEKTIGGSKRLLTYSVALASPLPKIEFPVGINKTVTLVPFAKSVQVATYQPTNQIVDFYVEQIANTDTLNTDISVNNGRPFAKFRINFEDVEQGADHDMDAIALYTLSVNATGALDVRLDSEYAAGGATQNMGYIISGTNKDGIYLDICDLKDGSTSVCANTTTYYRLNTPPGRDPGYCENQTSGAGKTECSSLPVTATRTFTASSTASATLLNDPLWYAAKYGNTTENWDADTNGVPDNYFLVTNASTLKAQLDKAFGSLAQNNNSVAAPAAGSEPVGGSSTDQKRAIYRSTFNLQDWSGELIKETINSAGSKQEEWRASSLIPTSRTIDTIKMADAVGALTNFTWDNLSGRRFGGKNLQDVLNTAPGANGATDGYGPARVQFIRGEACTASGCDTFRKDAPPLGDFIGSSPVVVAGAQYLGYIADTLNGTAGDYRAFKEAQEAKEAQGTEAARPGRQAMVYIGANDGMLHAFNATNGDEIFAFVPTAVIENLNKLPQSDYTNQTNNKHQYYVDGAITVRDVYYGGAWHTVLVGALGAGGREVYALDITNPSAITLLWEFTTDSAGSKVCSGSVCQPSDLGYSIPAPTIARLHNGKWNVVISNGYNSPNGDSGKAVLFILDIETGALVKRMDAAGTANISNGLSTAKLADNNSDSIADYAYAGDMQGNLWRFDLIGSANRNDDPAGGVVKAFNISSTPTTVADEFQVSFGGKPLYTATTKEGIAQSITSAPSLIRHPTRVGYIVAFGTGRYLGLSDKVSPFSMDTLYGIWDKQTRGQSAQSTISLDRSALQQQTLTQKIETFTATSTAADGTTKTTTTTRTVRLLSQTDVRWHIGSGLDTDGDKYGWYLDLAKGATSDGERIVDDMIKAGGVLIVPSLTPNSDPCASGIDGFHYGLDPATGGRTVFNVFDLNDDGKIDSNDQSGINVVTGYQAPAGGITLTDGDKPGVPPCLRGPDGKCMGVNLGPDIGRQSWRITPNTPPAP